MQSRRKEIAAGKKTEKKKRKKKKKKRKRKYREKKKKREKNKKKKKKKNATQLDMLQVQYTRQMVDMFQILRFYHGDSALVVHADFSGCTCGNAWRCR